MWNMTDSQHCLIAAHTATLMVFFVLNKSIFVTAGMANALYSTPGIGKMAL